MPAKRAFRLPTSVMPERYDLHLSVDPERSTFSGNVKIELRIDEPVREITLHARDIQVEEAAMRQKDQEMEAVVDVEPENEAIRVEPSQPLGEGSALLELDFVGKVSQAMQGLYLAQDGEEKCLVTQCEATDARAVFPCFDEPEFKAKLKWTITAPEGLQVLTNGLVEKRSPAKEEGRETWSFRETPPISSYLAACAVGVFEATDEVVEREIPHRVWAMGGKERFGHHARDFAARCQSWYEDYFGVKYPFAQYDQIAVPSFAFGAMENPGLVVFRPSLLLVDPEKAAWRERKNVDRVVAHEAAHMWFGNHVTMRWWDDLWLNESFAEWVAHKCVADLEPMHEIWVMFQSATDHAMGTDALATTHPIHADVATPEEAQEIFDVITYGKGSAVMRMIEDFLGEEDFREGLQDYMRRFGGKNAQGNDLWRHLAEASGKPVDQVMEDWVSRPGHPLVRASLQDSKEPRIVLQQERAYVMPPEGGAPEEKPWPVPVVLRYRDRVAVKEVRHLLEEHETVVPLQAEGEIAWCVVNARDAGFYRVAPDARLFETLSSHYVELEPEERRGFLRDQWFLMKRGDQEVSRFLDMFHEIIGKETHYSVTQDLVGYARGLERMLEQAGHVEALGDLREWVVERFEPQLSKIGMPTSVDQAHKDPQGSERRAALFSAVAGIGMDRDHVELAHRIAQDEREDPQDLEAEIAQASVKLALMHGDSEHFQLHLDTYRKRREEKMAPQLVERYLYTLPSTRDDELIARVLELCKEGSVPNQAVGPILRLMLGEPHAQEAAWAYVRDNWEHLRKTVGDAWCPILVEGLGHLPPSLKDEAERFMTSLEGYARESSKRAREMLALSVVVQRDVVPQVAAWFEDHTG